MSKIQKRFDLYLQISSISYIQFPECVLSGTTKHFSQWDIRRDVCAFGMTLCAGIESLFCGIVGLKIMFMLINVKLFIA